MSARDIRKTKPRAETLAESIVTALDRPLSLDQTHIAQQMILNVGPLAPRSLRVSVPSLEVRYRRNEALSEPGARRTRFPPVHCRAWLVRLLLPGATSGSSGSLSEMIAVPSSPAPPRPSPVAFVPCRMVVGLLFLLWRPESGKGLFWGCATRTVVKTH